MPEKPPDQKQEYQLANWKGLTYLHMYWGNCRDYSPLPHCSPYWGQVDHNIHRCIILTIATSHLSLGLSSLLLLDLSPPLATQLSVLITPSIRNSPCVITWSTRSHHLARLVEQSVSLPSTTHTSCSEFESACLALTCFGAAGAARTRTQYRTSGNRTPGAGPVVFPLARLCEYIHQII